MDSTGVLTSDPMFFIGKVGRFPYEFERVAAKPPAFAFDSALWVPRPSRSEGWGF